MCSPCSACSIARPTAAAIAALKARPAIAGLNRASGRSCPTTIGMRTSQISAASALLAPVSHHAPDEIDAHPLVREHFGERLKAEKPEAWRAGHGRLYEHLQDSAKQLPDTLAEMAPLFQAMHHGCQAGRHQEALDEVYWARIYAADEFYSTKKLGAFGADLAALAGLFDPPWDKPVATLTEADQALILNQAAVRSPRARAAAGGGGADAVQGWSDDVARGRAGRTPRSAPAISPSCIWRSAMSPRRWRWARRASTMPTGARTFTAHRS